MKTSFSVILVLILLAGCHKESHSAVTTNKKTLKSGIELPFLPGLSGKIVFHRYQEYGGQAEMWLYHFETDELTFISKDWSLWDPINGHFSPDGSQLVFMAQADSLGKWDVYRWDIGSVNLPINLTAGLAGRCEDPKFSPNGQQICFKHNGQIKIMNLNGTVTASLPAGGVECSMPFFTADGASLLYTTGVGEKMDVCMAGVDGSNFRVLAGENLQEYYPIAYGNANFIYTRHVNSTNHYDQLYMGCFFCKAMPWPLPFNTDDANYSDPYPCDENLILLSSTKRAGSDYDLYVADIHTGAIWYLNNYNPGINSAAEELGAAYSPE